MALDAETTEELLYQGFQARFLEEGVRKLASSGDLSSEYADFRIDPRSLVIAQAMRSRADGRGDACAPGPLAPGPALAFGATPLEFLRCAGRKGTSPAAARGGGQSWNDPRRALFGWGGPRGIMTQVMAGAALAFLQRGEDRAALVFEEWRAVETGAWHEGMSLATAARVPLIAGLVRSRPDADCSRPDAGCSQGAPGLAEIAANYGAGVAQVGSEALTEVRRTVRQARRRVAGGAGPVLIELLPLEGDRWAGHEELASRATEDGFEGRRQEAVRSAAKAGVDHALTRLRKEPEPRPSDALSPVTADAAPSPPWTRLDPPQPGGEPSAAHAGREADSIAGRDADSMPWAAASVL